MISYQEAKAIVIAAGRKLGLGTEFVVTQELVGRVCAEDLSAPIDIQPFDNSAMDGFALRMGDLAETGGVLTNTGIIAAGDPVPETALNRGECINIMTGAPTPPGADAVVPIELVQVRDDQVHFQARPEFGANIRKAGEDLKQGMAVISSGQLIQPQHIMPFAALGIDRVRVYKKPRAVFLATGSELVEDLATDLRPGQIYNSNRPYAVAALEAMGVECQVAPSVPDDPERFATLLKGWVTQDIDFIISSGAVSAGAFDFVRKGLEQAGADILFHKIKIKPGKPNLFARLPNGMLYFGLPGNPVATAAGLRFLVQAAMRSMMGMEEEQPVRARAIGTFKKRAGPRMFLKARVKGGEDGVLGVDLLEGQASFMVRPFLGMNCWALAPEEAEAINPGDLVDVYPLYPHAGFL